jgi:hypothetical protein
MRSTKTALLRAGLYRLVWAAPPLHMFTPTVEAGHGDRQEDTGFGGGRGEIIGGNQMCTM